MFVLLAEDPKRFQFAYDSDVLTQAEVGKIVHSIVTTIDDSSVSDYVMFTGIHIAVLGAAVWITVLVLTVYIY